MAEHYVDNQRFLGELIEYQKERKQAKTDGIPLNMSIIILWLEIKLLLSKGIIGNKTDVG